MLRDRHVLTSNEAMAVEFEAGLVVLGPLGIVVESPRPSPAMHQMADFILVSRPEALDTAALAPLAPLVGQQMPSLVQQRSKFIAALTAAAGELVVAERVAPENGAPIPNYLWDDQVFAL